MPKTGLVVAAAWCWLCGCSGILAAASNTNSSPGASFVVKNWLDGLPQSSVIAMTQTRDGYLWLGTLKGLVRFDGVNFTVFDENNTPGLNSSRIVYLFEDSRRNLWVGTETAGIALIKDGKVIDTTIGTGTPEGKLMAACEDSTGAVWLYTADGRLCRYEDGNMKTGPFGVNYLSVYRGLAAEKSGPVWIGVDWGLYGMSSITNADPRDAPVDRIIPSERTNTVDFVLASQNGGYWRMSNGRVQKWRFNQLERDLGAYAWSNVRVTAACEDLEGNLIIGTLGGGVYWYDAEGKVTRISRDVGLSWDGVLSLCMDREGSLWVGTDGGGLNRVKRNAFVVAEASRDWVVQSACADGAGGMWMAFQGGGATYWKGDTVRDFGDDQGLKNVWTVFVDKEKQVWAGTRRAGLWLGGIFQQRRDRFELSPGSEALNRDIFAIHQDRSGRLWVGTQRGLAFRDSGKWKVYTRRNGLLSDSVRAIADDPDGNLWIGTAGGLNLLQNGRLAGYRKRENHLPSDNISSLYVDGEGVLWIGTGGGLARFKSGRWTSYTKKDGLTSNGIAYLIEDGQGDLWIGSNAGLMRVPKQSLNDFAQGFTNRITCRTYGRPDGLPTFECTEGSQPAACRTTDGRLWFPTTKGLVSVKPAELRRNPYPPPVIIESVQIEGEEQNTNNLLSGWLKAVTIPARKEGLEIRYTSLNLTAAERARFKYRMEGYDKGWFDAGDSRVARYPKLPPGDYRFRVAAGNEDGVWNEEGASFAVVALPAFWQTWSFRSVTAVCLLGIIIGIVYYLATQKLQRQLVMLRQQEALEKERARIARDLHDQLGANLTQVALLGELAEADKHLPDEVESHARQISQTARDTTRSLDEIVWAANPANDTLDSLITYACKYAQDYLALAGLRHRLDVPAQLPDANVPPEVRHNVFLAFKEAVNNVVKHAQASEARIRLVLNSETFTLEVEDNGRGLDGLDEKAAVLRSGLRNMRKRMEDIHGMFSIMGGTDGGTSVKLTAPLGKGRA